MSKRKQVEAAAIAYFRDSLMCWSDDVEMSDWSAIRGADRQGFRARARAALKAAGGKVSDDAVLMAARAHWGCCEAEGTVRPWGVASNELRAAFIRSAKLALAAAKEVE